MAELDRVLRRGESTLRATPVPGAELVVPAAYLDGFSTCGIVGRGALRGSGRSRSEAAPEWPAGSPSRCGRPAVSRFAACTAARLTGAEVRDTAVVIAGNNLALGHQSRSAAAYAADPSAIRAGHVLDCFDTDALGAVGEVTGCRGEGWPIGGSSAAGALALIQAARTVASGRGTARPRRRAGQRPLPVGDRRLREGRGHGPDHRGRGLRRGLPALRRESRRLRPGIHIAAAVLVEPAAEARRRGVRPLGRMLGSGTGTDGRRGTQPETDGQVRAMRAALADAGLTPPDIDYVNAHGTGSVIGDDSEAAALGAVFGTAPRERSAKARWSTRPRPSSVMGRGAAGPRRGGRDPAATRRRLLPRHSGSGQTGAARPEGSSPTPSRGRPCVPRWAAASPARCAGGSAHPSSWGGQRRRTAHEGGRHRGHRRLSRPGLRGGRGPVPGQGAWTRRGWRIC
ncbi:hypothetical protein ACRAWF_30570 [Streptomyces sp. L7]